MRKRFCSLLLAAALLLGVLAAPQQAHAAGTLAISSVSAPRGETVEVTVSLTSDNVYSGNFDLRYDADTLELVSARSALPSSMVNTATAGVVRLTFASLTALTDTVVCYLTFRVTADTPAGGSPLTAERVRLYDVDGVLTQGSALSGSVSRDTVALRLSHQVTAAYQAVSVAVELAGGLSCAGGNFTVGYDPACFQVRSVLAGDGAPGVSLTWNVVSPGTLRVAFSSAETIPAGALCRVVLQTVTEREQSSAVTLSDARVYDEGSQLLDVSLENSAVAITAPSDRDPKLWVVGGQLDENGTAEVAVVFQGRSAACGGNFTLTLGGDVEVLTWDCASGVTCARGDAGLNVAWGSAVPGSGELRLLTLRLSGGQVGDAVGFDAVRVYDKDSASIPVVEVRPSTLQREDGVAAVIDQRRTSTVTENGATTCTVAVDIASTALGGAAAVETVAPVLALYDSDSRLVALKTDTVRLTGGVGEVTLTAETGQPVSSARVFLLDGGDYAPLCAALERGDVQQ